VRYDVMAATAALIAFGFFWGRLHGRVSERRKLRLEREKFELDKMDALRIIKANDHEHIGTVIRCTPHEQTEVTPFGLDGSKTRLVPGTNVLMRCEKCGIFWLKWFPGTWTPDDFARTKPEDMDKVVRSLTEGGNTP
jgi:hypothetical protein